MKHWAGMEKNWHISCLGRLHTLQINYWLDRSASDAAFSQISSWSLISQFLEALELHNVLSGQTSHRQIQIPVDYTSPEVFHSFSKSTPISSTLWTGSGATTFIGWSNFCNQEEFFSLVDCFQLKNICDRLQHSLVEQSDGKDLVENCSENWVFNIWIFNAPTSRNSKNNGRAPLRENSSLTSLMSWTVM